MGNTGRLRLEFLAGGTALVLGLWAGVALLVYQAHRQVVESAVAVGRNLSRSLSEYQDSSVRAIDLSLRQLRERWLRDPASFDEAVGQHEDHLSKEKVIQVAVVGPDGGMRYSRLPQPSRLNFSDRVLQDIELGPHGVIMLARPDGTILARSGGLERTRDVKLDGWTGIAEGGPLSGEFRAPGRVDGVERFFSYRKLQNYPLTLYVGQGVETVLAPYYRQRNLLLGGGALATIVVLLVVLLLVARTRERARFLEERERVMLELHDSSIQSIYAIGLTLESSRRLVEKDPAQAARTLADAGANLNLVIQDLRAFITRERRAPLSEQEFMLEIERMIPPPEQGAPRFSVDVERALIAALSPDQAGHVLRMAREAVSNIVRHAKASNAGLVLRRRDESVRLEVSDDGVGIGPRTEARLGLGLHHIQARARKLRGKASFDAAPAGGTRVAVEFPLRGRA